MNIVKLQDIKLTQRNALHSYKLTMRKQKKKLRKEFHSPFQAAAAATAAAKLLQLCPTLCDPMNCSTPGLPVHYQLPEFIQTHVHQVGDAI